MASATKEVVLPLDSEAKVIHWKVKEGTKISHGSVLCILRQDGSKADLKLKSEEVGTVSKLVVPEGTNVQPRSPLLEMMTGCTHSVVMKDMCAECGADLREFPGVPGERKVQALASVAMVHSIPELVVSQEEAMELGKEDEGMLLKSKKLVLLVDLDQTLIHTTNEEIPANLKGVYHFQLRHGGVQLWYHTKFRPRTQEFLESISKLYELHICTFGARMYAHTIAGLLDPEGKFFSHRILSRDECFNPTTKTANMKSLFPCGDSMVCIIDDREDVWCYAPNLIHVKPYRFFKGTGDINAPPGSQSDREAASAAKEKDKVKDTEDDTEVKPSQESRDPRLRSRKNSDDSSAMEVSDNLKNDTDNKVERSNRKDSEQSEEVQAEGELRGKSDIGEMKASESIQTPETMTDESNDKSSDTKEEEVVWEDEDDNSDVKYLNSLENILTRIHTKFYEALENAKNTTQKEPPNLKDIIPSEKRTVLQGVNLVFSGVFPTNIPLEKSRAYIVARSLGATVHTKIVKETGPDDKNGTTHVVAARLGTSKVNEAKRLSRVQVVNPDWLWAANETWEKPDESLYPLNEETSEKYSTPSNPDIAPSQKVRQHANAEKGWKRKSEDDDSLGARSESGAANSKPPKRQKSDSRNEGAGIDANDVVDDDDDDDETVLLDADEDMEPLKPARRGRQFSDDINPLMTFSKEDWDNMGKEVDEEAFEDSDLESSDDDDETREQKLRQRVLSNEESGEETEDSLSGDIPAGWKNKVKKMKSRKTASHVGHNRGGDNENDSDDDGYKDEDDERNDTEDTISRLQKSFGCRESEDEFEDDEDDKDFDSIGSVDEEMAAAIEKEFMV
ncbi:RNA polymerase II subunit A C-terminal domain phosphatase-like [Lingula anatina]|uniref:RNA polymerase II subunit A C-terminal domain phosphatase n=1 Tax=Lingula anatina TaxID=7574 RepID=A0A1S3K5N8_LINAN|nr:RNA polymerase II subunit A C-terminal domain phosphatase-like [Lingula anatina]|eukprot:XP_013417744.1 RNA polymerase II subunit A C-terminal domain phosphatase-like [Lingula anatina]